MATLTLTLDDVRDLIVAADTPDTERLLKLVEESIAEATSTGIAGRIDAISTHQSMVGTAFTLLPKAVQNGFSSDRAAEIHLKALKDLMTCQVLLLSVSRGVSLIEQSIEASVSDSEDPTIKALTPLVNALNSVPALKMSPFREIYFPASATDASR